VLVPPGLDAASVRAVFVDLDGTVLQRARASEAVAPAIARLQATGVRCVIATGRMLTSARRYAAQFDVTAPLVCYQGAVIGNPQTGEVLRHEPIPRDTARDLVGAIRAAGYAPLAFVDEGVYVSVDSEIARQYSQSAGVPYEVVGDLERWISAPVTKLVTAGEPDEMDALRDALLPEFGMRAFIAKSLPYYLEAAAPGVSKASGAAYVCDLLGFDAADCIAIGDGENDVELLDWAGYAIGVDGGHEPLLEQADFVCPPVADDGVPQTLTAIAEARE
jgi:Cof subfamily protein (haloacid dehalogenase superfamily)